MYRFLFKRIFDITLASLLLLICMPLLIVTTLLVWIFLGYPVIFRQERPGLNGKIFTLYKFRTMLVNHKRNDSVLSDEQRLTWFGKLLRSLSIDELPELINVIKGDMSLIGPRPLLIEYLQEYSPKQHQRHRVKPGITGWAQVNGRNQVSWNKRFALDVWYVNNYSFCLDVKIILLTIIKVFKREGISEAGQATMSKFIRK